MNAVRAERAAGAPIRLHLGRDQLGTPDWGRELTVEFLYAYPGSDEGLGSGNTLENNASIVLRITYGNQSILFMGERRGRAGRFARLAEVRRAAAARLSRRGGSQVHRAQDRPPRQRDLEHAAVHRSGGFPEVVVVSSGRKSYGGTFLPTARR